MKLTREELGLVLGYMRGEETEVPGEILERMELGIWSSDGPFPFGIPFRVPFLEERLPGDAPGPLLISGYFGRRASLWLLDRFREKHMRWIMIRVESWSCHLRCGDEILSEHCDENLDALNETCRNLRDRCLEQNPRARF